MNDDDDQRIASINRSVSIEVSQSSLTSPLLSDYEIVHHFDTRDILEQDKSLEHPTAGN